MLKINTHYWGLYKNSPSGKRLIERFKEASLAEFSNEQAISLLRDFDKEWFYNTQVEQSLGDFSYVEFIINNLLSFWVSDSSVVSRNQAEHLFERMFHGDYERVLNSLIPLSFFLYKKDPNYFLPYMFLMRYKYIRQIMEDYDLDINEIPGKASYKARCLYYLDICDAFYKFRKLNEMNSSELCAWIYGLERERYDSKYLSDNTSYPQVWLISGSKKTAKEANDSLLFWHANEKTRKGDILVFYETKDTYYSENSSSITGIWKAQTDGISDPFFHYYGSTLIGEEIKIKPIPFKILKNDERTKTLPRIGANFLGVSGDAIKTSTYEGLLELIEERDSDFDRSLLPTLHEPFKAKVKFEDRGKMKPEKWVEEYLIKEMLEQMGWGRDEIDYRRQVHLQLGRAKIEGEKTQDGRTDFSLFPFGNKKKCADVLIEAKAPGEMDGKDIEVTFWQAESYASRQYAGLIILADGEKVLLYPRSKDGTFKFSNNPESYTWYDIFNDIDKFNKLRNTILSFRKHMK